MMKTAFATARTFAGASTVGARHDRSATAPVAAAAPAALRRGALGRAASLTQVHSPFATVSSSRALTVKEISCLQSNDRRGRSPARLGTFRSILRIYPFARIGLAPHRARDGRRAARGRRRAAHSAGAATAGRRPAEDRRLGADLAGGRHRARARRARGDAHRAAPVLRAAAGHPRRGGHAQLALRAAAGPARELPRPLAVRPAAVARDQRPEPHPSLDLVRHRAADREHPDDRGRLRVPRRASRGSSA